MTTRVIEISNDVDRHQRLVDEPRWHLPAQRRTQDRHGDTPVPTDGPTASILNPVAPGQEQSACCVAPGLVECDFPIHAHDDASMDTDIWLDAGLGLS